MPRTDGVDVSEYQGDIDWAAVPNLDFVVAKATQRGVDKKWHRNWEGMRSRGFAARGAYHFNDNPSQRTMRQQAAFFKSTVGELIQGEFPVIDFEPWDGGGIPIYNRQQSLDLINAVEDYFQRQAMIYCGKDHPALQVIGDRPWWLPSYGISEAGMLRQAHSRGVEAVVWQWGGGGVPYVGTAGADVPGITPGRAEDTNQIQNRDRLLAWAGSGTTPVQEDDDMANADPFIQRTSDGHPHLIFPAAGIRVNYATLDGETGDKQVSIIKYVSALSGKPIVEHDPITDSAADFLILRSYREIPDGSAILSILLDAIHQIQTGTSSVDEVIAEINKRLAAPSA